MIVRTNFASGGSRVDFFWPLVPVLLGWWWRNVFSVVDAEFFIAKAKSAAPGGPNFHMSNLTPRIPNP